MDKHTVLKLYSNNWELWTLLYFCLVVICVLYWGCNVYMFVCLCNVCVRVYVCMCVMIVCLFIGHCLNSTCEWHSDSKRIKASQISVQDILLASCNYMPMWNFYGLAPRPTCLQSYSVLRESVYLLVISVFDLIYFNFRKTMKCYKP